MIPIPGTWTAARVLVVVVVALALLTAGAYAGWKSANDAWTARWEKRESELLADLVKEQARNRAIETKANEDVAKLRDDHAARLNVLGADLGVALDELRRAKARAALRPAEAAPAPCRDFAASPTQLSEPDAEFLVRFASEADGIAIRLGTCQRYVTAIHSALTGK